MRLKSRMRGGGSGEGTWERKQGPAKVCRQMGWWDEDRQVPVGQRGLKVGGNRNGTLWKDERGGTTLYFLFLSASFAISQMLLFLILFLSSLCSFIQLSQLSFFQTTPSLWRPHVQHHVVFLLPGIFILLKFSGIFQLLFELPQINTETLVLVSKFLSLPSKFQKT